MPEKTPLGVSNIYAPKPLKRKKRLKNGTTHSFNKLHAYDRFLFYLNLSLVVVFVLSLSLYATTFGIPKEVYSLADKASEFFKLPATFTDQNLASNGNLTAKVEITGINLDEPDEPEDAMLLNFSQDIANSTDGKEPSEGILGSNFDPDASIEQNSQTASSLTPNSNNQSVNSQTSTKNTSSVPRNNSATSGETSNFIPQVPNRPVASPNRPVTATAPKPSTQNVSFPKPSIPAFSDQLGKQITYDLSKVGYNMGFIFSTPLKNQGFNLPFAINNEGQNSSFNPNQPLQNIRSANPNGPKNKLEFPKFNVTAPIIYTSFQDLFGSKPDGTIDFYSDPGTKNYGTESPVQIKLKDGVVHMAFSPMPGEIGNSYVIGHTSNFSYVKSNYNSIFAPLVYKTQNGDEFFVYDQEGRKLKFRVFESLAINETDIATAYKTFGDKRVVTLQGSILERVNGRNIPTKRWLVRGELVD